LARLIDAWATLPQTVRKQIIDLAEAHRHP
jgi:hypothetical protein